MKIEWEFKPDEIQVVKDLVDEMKKKKDSVTLERLNLNIEGVPKMPSDETIWLKHIHCLITTQQKSGANSRVAKLMRDENSPNFPLSLKGCRQQAQLYDYAFSVIQPLGLRRNQIIPKAIVLNLKQLDENNVWQGLRTWASRLVEMRKSPPDPSQRSLEREAANYVDRNFSQFGLKQSRNFWQLLGLTRYNSVLDSRVLKWIKANLKPQYEFVTEQGLLQNESYYLFVSDIIFDLCQQAGILPCLFDGAVFDYFEK